MNWTLQPIAIRVYGAKTATIAAVGTELFAVMGFDVSGGFGKHAHGDPIVGQDLLAAMAEAEIMLPPGKWALQSALYAQRIEGGLGASFHVTLRGRRWVCVVTTALLEHASSVHAVLKQHQHEFSSGYTDWRDAVRWAEEWCFPEAPDWCDCKEIVA